jgi:uncharacterized protein
MSESIADTSGLDSGIHEPEDPSKLTIAQPIMPKRKPRVWPLFVFLLLGIFLTFVVQIVAMVPAAIFLTDFPINDTDGLVEAMEEVLDDPRVMIILGFTTGMALLITTLAACLVSPVPWRERLNLHSPRIGPMGWLIAIIGTLCFGVTLTGLQGLNIVPPSETIDEIFQAITSSGNDWIWAAVLVIGLMPGIDEELFFRGYIQTRLTERWGTFVAITITASLFGIIHLDPVQGPFAAAIGAYLGYLTVLTRSVIPAMMCHAFNNTLFVLLALIFPSLDPPEDIAINWVIIAVSIFILVLCVRYLRRQATELNTTNPDQTTATPQ